MKPYEEFQEFLKKFVSQIDPDDQLPIRVSNYTITESEFKPEVTNFARQYLQDNDCPTVLLNAIVNNVLADVLDPSKESPLHCGFEAIQNHYQPLKLMQAVISKVNAVCSRLLDNAELMKLMPEDCVDAGSVVPALPKYSAMGVKNSRRKMEDRHVVIQDFHELYSGKKSPRCSYYGLFDGHGGAEAAIYSVAHLAYHLRNSNYYPEYPGKAISDAFNETDQAIISKYHTDSFRSGTTALVVLHFPDEKLMNVAWVGDSQALIVKNGETVQIVKSHKATEQSERDRIIEAGGEIFQLQGVFRVQGQIAITRAIGDTDLKQFIISEPEIVSFELDGDEDFVIMASDGLWDVVSDDGAASEVYNRLKEDPDCYKTIPKKLIQLAKDRGSSDNITIIVIYLKEPSEIAKFSWPSADPTQPLDNMETTTTTDPMAATNENPFGSYAFENSNQDHFNGLNGTTTNNMNNNKFIEPAFDGNENLLNFDSQTTTTTTAVTKGVIDADDLMNENNLQPTQGFDNEFGPETDVDAVDESMLMSSPHSVSQEEDDQMLGKEYQQFEQKEIDFTEAPVPTNPFGDDFIHHELQQPEHVTIEDDNSHSENDKSAAEQEYEAFLKHTAGQLSNEERNVFGLPKEVLGGVDEDAEKVIESSVVDDENAAAIVADYDEDDEEAPAKDDDLLTGDEGAAESAVGVAAAAVSTAVDSEAESDDEWNYVKPGADKGANQEDATVAAAAEGGAEVSVEAEKAAEESLIQEQHGEAQALAEAQEHCVELDIGHNELGVGGAENHLAEEDQLLQPVLPEQQQQEEIVAAPTAADDDHLLSTAETPESTSLLSVDTTEADQAPIIITGVGGPEDEDEDMSSQLNPDAQEFVPLSPQSSAPVSPALKMDLEEHFIGLQQPQIAAIVDEDRILAQSPRKNNGNTAVLDNVALPDEREFDEEISNRPHEWSGDLLGNGAKQPAEAELNGSFVAAGGDATANGEAAESSSQDMIIVDDEDSVALNSKEERDLDEEKEDCVKELRDDKIKEIIDNIPDANEEEGHNGKAVPGEEDPMNMSFHQDVHTAPSANPFDMNAVQLLPTDDIYEEESEYSEKPEADTQMAVEQRMAELNLSNNNRHEEPQESPLPESQQETKAATELTESESNFYMQQPEEEPERKEFDEKDEEEHVIKAAEAAAAAAAQESQQPEADASPVKAETPPPTPAAINDRDLLLQALSPEPEKLVEAVAEKLVEEEEKKDPISLGGALAVGVAVAGVAAAATAVAATKEKPLAKKATATPPAKKDVAAKPKTPATAVGVKASPTTRATPTRTATTASKVASASKLSPAVASKTSTATTPRPKVGAAATANKASPTTARSPLVEKKPLAPVAAKRTTPSRPATTTSSLTGASPKPTTPSRLTAARTPTSATSARTSTSATSASPKTATPRLSATTAKSAAAAAPAAKKATPTGGVASRTLTSKTSATTTAAAPRPRPASGTTTSSSTTTTTTVKKTSTMSSTLTANPRTTTTKTTTTSRLVNGTAAAKAPTAASRVSATKTTTTTAKVPSPAARPLSATTTSSTTSAAKKPIPGSASARAKAVSAPTARPAAKRVATTTTTTTATALKGSKPSPITKRNVVTTETTTATVVVEKSLLNGDAPAMTVTTVTKDVELIVNGNGEGHVLNGNGPTGDGEPQQKMVIDLTAD